MLARPRWMIAPSTPTRTPPAEASAPKAPPPRWPSRTAALLSILISSVAMISVLELWGCGLTRAKYCRPLYRKMLGQAYTTNYKTGLPDLPLYYIYYRLWLQVAELWCSNSPAVVCFTSHERRRRRIHRELSRGLWQLQDKYVLWRYGCSRLWYRMYLPAPLYRYWVFCLRR